MSAWFIHKFGGSSLARASGFERAAELIRRPKNEWGDLESVAVVVSATGGTTDRLLKAVDQAASQDAGWRNTLHAVRDRNVAIAHELLGEHGPLLESLIDANTKDLEDVLRGVQLSRTATEQTRELVSGYGELWSAQMLHAHIVVRYGTHTAWLDAREVLVVKQEETGPAVQWETTAQKFAAWQAQHPCDILVVTGYVASDPLGVPTSLKRNGSDFSASIFGKLLTAESITIWTDVDGVLSADPNLVPDAVLVPHLSYHEAAELAYFGASVLHPHTMGPAIAADIPIRIRNAAHPERPGTELSAGSAGANDGSDEGREGALKGVSSSSPVALLNLEGVGLIGVPGVAQRLFGCLRDVGVSVVLISQAGSEHSICAAVPTDQGEAAREAAQEAFAAELQRSTVQTIDLDGPYRIVAAVGDHMVRTPGVAARVFGALGAARVNVRAIAQGASERNISVVVREEDAARAVRSIHAAFYLSDQTISVGLIGTGRIGSELLRQIAAERERLRDELHIDLRIRAIARSRAMLLADQEVDPSAWEEAFAESSTDVDIEAFARHVRAEHLPHAAIIDCSASSDFNEWYPAWLEAGIHVVTANKHATAGPLDLFRRIREPRTAHYFGEATVGAGLPVIHSLRDLIQTGDRIERIEGVLSGTLSYLFNELSDETPLSAVVRRAHSLGYTEPDPREDLSGMDVARKALILGREMGLELEEADVQVESLVPAALMDFDGEVEAFLDQLADHDGTLLRRWEEARARGEVLRYVASIDPSGARVGVEAFPGDHPFSSITGADNIVAFTTERYRERPMVVQGPGAGPAVTAGGVFGDLLRLAHYLGAPS